MVRFLRAVAMAVVGASGLALANPFTGDELEGVQTIVMSLLTVGAAIVIALVVYRLARRAINRV